MGQLLVLLASLAGIFAMHGMSDHGTAGPSGVAASHVAAHLSMPLPAAPPDTARAQAGPAAYSDSPPRQPIGGHDMGLAGICLAVLVAVLMLSSALWRRLPRTMCAGLPPWPARQAAVGRARAPTPPDLFALCIHRC